MKQPTRTGRRRATRTVAWTSALVSALALTGCGGSSGGNNATQDTSSPGVTDSSIKLGTTQPLTGPAAPGYSKISAAMKAYFEFVNDQGGVNGRKIELLIEDDGYNPTNTATKTRQLVLKDKVFAMVGALGTPTHTAVLDFLKQNRVPDLFVSSGSRSWNQPDKYPTTFGWQPDYTVEGKILGDYIKKNFADKKICSFGQGDDFGADGVAGVEETLGKGSLASKQTYTPTNTNVAPQIGALKAAGCEVVVSFTVPGFTALELGTAAKLKFAPQWVISNVGADIPTLTGFLKEATVPLLEGAISDAYLPLTTDTDNSWTKLFLKVNKEYNDNAPYDGNVEYGMAMAYTTVQVLKAAGKDLDRGSLIEAVEKGGYTGPGLAPFRYSPDDHSGYAGTQVVKISNGKASTVGPVYITDDAGGALEEYTTEQPEAPADGIPED
ncbi:MAG TPA: ABC transporter substrate-binding protein [Marmoricola sp.]|jgi:ABC-type branched-subunit amino acid transport system substrate-binding protein|nr:ABC transporter substrate-binding protein [Marmoricola sp.]